MSWFSKLKISTVIFTCCSALVPYYLSKDFVIFEKVEDKFENIPEQFLRQINASPLHDEYRLLTYKSSMSYIVKILKFFVILRYVYGKFLSRYQFVSKTSLTNLSIHPSSLNGITIWTQLLIWKNYKISYS